MLKYGVVYGVQQDENSIWLKTLQEQEEKLLNGQYSEEIQQCQKLEQEGNFFQANKQYQDIKKLTKSSKVHRAINAKIQRNMIILRRNLQEKQSDFSRVQTSYLEARTQKTPLEYDSPRPSRDPRYSQNREKQYLEQCGFEQAVQQQ